MRQSDFKNLKSRINRSRLLLSGLALVLPSVAPLLMPASAASASATFNTYPATSSYKNPGYVTTANGSLWYVESTSSTASDSIGNMTTSGTVTDYNVSVPAGATKFSIYSLTTGPDGNIWFDGCADSTGGVYAGNLNVSTGVVTFYQNTQYEVSCYGGGAPGAITAGSDGYVWYADHNYDYAGFHEYLFSVNPSTGATSAAYTLSTNNTPVNGLTTGPDGKLWATNSQYNQILAETVSSGSRTGESYYPIPTSSSGPGSITAGPDGNLWFVETGVSPYKITKVTTSGTFTEYTQASGVSPGSLAAGPDGAVWFNDGAKVGRISSSGGVTEYTIPGSDMNGGGITLGPDGAMWFEYRSGSSSFTYGLGRLGY